MTDNTLLNNWSECLREDCRLSYTPGPSTDMLFTQEYDKHGNALNENPNTTTNIVRCSACNGKWLESCQGKTVTVKRITEENSQKTATYVRTP